MASDESPGRRIIVCSLMSLMAINASRGSLAELLVSLLRSTKPSTTDQKNRLVFSSRAMALISASTRSSSGDTG
jgi:hypothetical protein